MSFCKTIGQAVKLSNFVKLVIVFALIQGSFLAFGTNISVLFTPVGFSNVEISILGAAVITTGVVASAVAGVFLNKYHKYLLMIRISAFGVLMFMAVGIFTF